MENLTDLGKISISEGLNVGALDAEMSLNQFGTDGKSLQLDKTLLEENNVDKVLGTSSLDGLINFVADEATSKIVDGACAVRSRLTEGEPWKRKSKPTESQSQTTRIKKKKTAFQSTQKTNCSG